MKISEYRRSTFTEQSRPAINTIKKWVDSGDIPGQIIGGNYFVVVGEVQPINDLVMKVLMK